MKIWRDVVISAERSLNRHKAREKPAPVPRPAAAALPRDTPPPGVRPQVASAGVEDPGDIAAGSDVVGPADVVDTSTLDVDGQRIHLLGVAPMSGRPARALAHHLRRREVDCVPTDGKTFRCTVDGDDLATTILVNGGSSATDDAPPDLVAAQNQARSERRGIWGRLR